MGSRPGLGAAAPCIYAIIPYRYQGRIQDCSKGGEGDTGSNNFVMAFLPRNIVGCLFTKRLTKGGGGHGHPRTPLATPLFIRRAMKTFILIIWY